MYQNATTWDVIRRITDAELAFRSYLSVLRETDRSGFGDALSDAGYRLWRGEISAVQYDGIFRDLKRDAKGTAAAYRSAAASLIDTSRERAVVTRPRRAVVR